MQERERRTGKGTILIVDDIEMNRLILKEMIQGMGYFPLLAESGERALELMEETRPLLVLTDISMPGIDGYELCRRLKEQKDTKQIPVIFISAFDDPEDMVVGFNLGGADYITKPFVPEVVRGRVGVHLRLYEASQELMEMNRRLQTSVKEQLRQMESEKRDILYALANIAAQNAGYKKAHMERLQKNCQILAQGMQLSKLFENRISDAYVDAIALAAPLCDIGNIGIARELLQKPDVLTAEEEAAVQKHTELGARLLEDLYVNNDYNDFIGMAVDVARCHHERWDGGGYPGGLQREEIPLAARIVAVADRYCVLTEEKGTGENSSQPEVPGEQSETALSQNTAGAGETANRRKLALECLRQEMGSRFQPEIVQICCKIAKQFV